MNDKRQFESNKYTFKRLDACVRDSLRNIMWVITAVFAVILVVLLIAMHEVGESSEIYATLLICAICAGVGTAAFLAFAIHDTL